MSTPEPATLPTVLATADDAVALVRAIADEVHDPCGMAIGLRIGVSEMGLLRRVVAERGPDGWEVSIDVRLTSPGCQYFFYFQEQLTARLLSHPEFTKVTVRWDEQIDWTPDDYAASAREKIAARRQAAPALSPTDSHPGTPSRGG